MSEQGAIRSNETGECENTDQTVRKRLEILSKRLKEFNNKEHTAQKRLEIWRPRIKPLEDRKTDRSKETEEFDNEGWAARKRLVTRDFDDEEQTTRKETR